MKKRYGLVIMLCLLLVCAYAQAKEATIFVYLCGADLESDYGEATTDLREMIASGVGSSKDFDVIVATGGASSWSRYGISSRSVQYYRLGASQPELLQDLGRKNMGDPTTLSDFLRFGVQQYPANRYALVLWDHGGGPVYGMCYDENYRDDPLTLSEFRSALQTGLQGERLDIIALDCCLMNCVDLMEITASYCDYTVASQELVTGTGLNYDAWIEPWLKDPQMSSLEVASRIARTYVEENAKGRNADTATMSVIESAQVPAMLEALDAFSQALQSRLNSQLSAVVRARASLTSFGEFADYDASDLVDLMNLCDALSSLMPSECARLQSAGAECVVYNATTQDIASQAHGLSLFLPYATARSDASAIRTAYGNAGSSYASLITQMASSVVSGGYTMASTSSSPSNFYSYSDTQGSSGAFVSIWDGLYGDYCSMDDVYTSTGGNIWAGLSGSSGQGSIWGGLPAFSSSHTPAPTQGSIWGSFVTPQITNPPATTQAPTTVLGSIWAGLLNTGSAYYQPNEENSNVQAGVSEAISPEEVVEEASVYFSASNMTLQSIYTLQLTKKDLDHLSSASGVLFLKENDRSVCLGNLGQTTIDWGTGLIYSMFDGSWPMLEGHMVRAEQLYESEDGSVRFVIPARINGIRMYILAVRYADGSAEVLGATQGYDENGFAIRGSIPLESGMTISPLYTEVLPNGREQETIIATFTVTEQALSLKWAPVPSGVYDYCFGLTDLSGTVQYTDAVTLIF